MFDSIDSLNEAIVSCRACERLVRYREYVASVKVKRFRDWEYWSKPVPGFGDSNARLLIIGLAPAAHGANRTGRMFTGDSSGSWLIKALYETGFTNKPTSMSRDDGLILCDVYITAVLRCAPPDNRPSRSEIGNCMIYLVHETSLLKNVRMVLTLGAIAFNAYCSINGISGLRFRHGSSYAVRDREGRTITLLSSYHPSRQNTQTGRLSWSMWIDIFRRIRLMLDTLDESEPKP
ncbi:MAG: uracil-DNA glycosylase [Candidatus Nitrosocaldus sp.]